MSISTFDSLRAKIANPFQEITPVKASFSNQSQLLYSTWIIADDAASTPSTAAAPTRATAGSLRMPPLFNSDGTMRLARVHCNTPLPNMWWLCDRLSHQGGLSGTATGAQTTNLPTAALTRYTSGAGVMVGLEIYTQIGASSTTVSASYTNQGGTSGQVTPRTVWGNTGFREANRFVLLPLASGDTGVQAVASVTNTATTGTAGNFGVTLFKPLFPFFVAQQGTEEQICDGLLSAGYLLPEIVDDACLFLLCCGNISGTGAMNFDFKFIED